MKVESPTEKLLAQKDGAIGWIVFNQPQKHNAVSFEMWQALPVVLDRFARDEEVRLVILKGAGEKAFISGADISQFGEKRSSAEAIAAYNAAADQAGRALQEFPKPTLAMVRGYCIGGGVAVAISCDLRVAADDTRYAIPAGKLGLGYRYSGVKRLIHLVGPARTAEIFYTARQFSAQEALQMGLVNQVVPAAELEQHTAEYANAIAGNAPLTLASIKRNIIEWHKDPAERNLDLTQQMVDACYASEDYKEGRTAFMEKRKPVFKGR
jgi:enoyl-CoA hydratase